MKKQLLIVNLNSSKKIGMALKRLRKNKNLTQSELAMKIKIRQATISDIENGKGGNLETVLKITNALDSSLILG